MADRATTIEEGNGDNSLELSNSVAGPITELQPPPVRSLLEAAREAAHSSDNRLPPLMLVGQRDVSTQYTAESSSNSPSAVQSSFPRVRRLSSW